MGTFVLLLRDDPALFRDLSPEEMQRIIEKYRAWGARVAAKGALLEGKKLKDDEGRVLERDKERLAQKDGPFGESKEMIGGIYLLRAASYDEVAEMCRDHPHLAFGTIEVRAVDAAGKEDD